MRRFRFPAISIVTALAASSLLAACGAVAPVGPGPSTTRSTGLSQPESSTASAPGVTAPAVISIDSSNGELEYWPILPKGGSHPVDIAKNVAQPGAMAANGNTIAIVNNYPSSSVVQYDVVTRKRSVMSDPFGEAADVAVGKDGSIYVLNLVPKNTTSNIAKYPPGSTQPKLVTCNLLGFGGSIAVDDASNIFINGYLANNNAGVIEISHAGSPCTFLNLNSENAGYIGGVAIDPKTDALVTLTEPDECAGGYEAEMTIYPKPYRRKTSEVREMNGNCTGGLRFSADSKTIFYGDEDVSGSFTFIRQATFPGGANMGTFYGGDASGMTTIPNTLPN